MELLRLRRRTELAKKGHKLLKDKLDGLIQRLASLGPENRRVDIEEHVGLESHQQGVLAHAYHRGPRDSRQLLSRDTQ